MILFPRIIYAIAGSRISDVVAVGRGDGVVTVRRALEPGFCLDVRSDWFDKGDSRIAVSAHGDFLAVAGYHIGIEIISIKDSGKRQSVLLTDVHRLHFDVIKNYECLIAECEDGVHVLDPTSLLELSVYPDVSKFEVDFRCDTDMYLIAGSSVKKVDSLRGRVLWKQPIDKNWPVMSMISSNCGLCIGSNDSTIRFLDAMSGREISLMHGIAAFLLIRCSATEVLAWCLGSDGQSGVLYRIKVCDMKISQIYTRERFSSGCSIMNGRLMILADGTVFNLQTQMEE